MSYFSSQTSTLILPTVLFYFDICGGGAVGAQNADLEIVGQPVSKADRKFLTLQKVLGASSFLSKLFLEVLKTMIISARKYDMS